MIPGLGAKGNQSDRIVRAGQWLEIALLPVIVVFIAVAAFGLGRLSALENQHGHLLIHYPGEATSTAVH
jgi:hypothetical protein